MARKPKDHPPPITPLPGGLTTLGPVGAGGSAGGTIVKAGKAQKATAKKAPANTAAAKKAHPAPIKPIGGGNGPL